MSKLYDTFTFGGNLVQRWKNYGLQPTWDARTQTLSFSFPEGWTDTMSETTRAQILSDWCIDEPTYDVKYAIELGGTVFPVRYNERDKGNLEFIANVNPFLDVTGKESIDLKFTASACNKTLTLVEGFFKLDKKLLQLGEHDNAGYLFNVGHGFALFVHFADEKKISSVAMLGKIENFTEGAPPNF